MALVAEDGTGRADAESPNTVEYLDDYHAKRGNARWATATTPQKEVGARRASDWQVASWEGRLSGIRTLATQALPYPRYDAWHRNGRWLLTNEVPAEWKMSHAELALVALDRALTVTIPAGGELKRVQIGPIEIERDLKSNPLAVYAQAEIIVRPLFQGSTQLLRA